MFIIVFLKDYILNLLIYKNICIYIYIYNILLNKYMFEYIDK